MRIFNLFIVMLIVCVLPGCSNPQSEGTSDVESYNVRGVVADVIPAVGKYGSMSILHEAIPDFRNREGEVVGMGVMAMNFSFSRELDIKGIKPKDKVFVSFQVRWDKNPRLLMTEISKLMPEEVLNLEGYSVDE